MEYCNNSEEKEERRWQGRFPCARPVVLECGVRLTDVAIAVKQRIYVGLSAQITNIMAAQHFAPSPRIHSSLQHRIYGMRAIHNVNRNRDLKNRLY